MLCFSFPFLLFVFYTIGNETFCKMCVGKEIVAKRRALYCVQEMSDEHNESEEENEQIDCSQAYVDDGREQNIYILYCTFSILTRILWPSEI